MNCLRSVSAGLVSIRYLGAPVLPVLVGTPCTRATLCRASAGPPIVAPGRLGSRCAALMLALPNDQLCGPTLPMPAVAGLAPWSLRRNRPFCPVGRLKPGRARGLICCCARLSGNCALRLMTTVLPVPFAEVFATLLAPAATAELPRMTLFCRSWVAMMLTLPPA